MEDHIVNDEFWHAQNGEPKRRRWIFWIIVIALIVAGAIGLYWFLGGFVKPAAPEQATENPESAIVPEITDPPKQNLIYARPADYQVPEGFADTYFEDVGIQVAYPDEYFTASDEETIALSENENAFNSEYYAPGPHYSIYRHDNPKKLSLKDWVSHEHRNLKGLYRDNITEETEKDDGLYIATSLSAVTDEDGSELFPPRDEEYFFFSPTVDLIIEVYWTNLYSNDAKNQELQTFKQIIDSLNIYKL